jgi:hypothetical protein
VTVAGSGVVIDGRRILTNAHLTTYATNIWVQAQAGGDRYPARVSGRGPDVDLAVLTLDDPSFFESHPPLPKAERLPAPMSEVTVYGFPVGGVGLSVTRGIISRVAYGGTMSGVDGLVLQIDAALNPGNSGGPAIVEGRMVGIARSRLSEGENIGYIVPNEEIDLFLADIDDGSYRGKPKLDFGVQAIENQGLRDKLKLDRKIRGVMITRVERSEPATIQVFDVLTHVGPHEIDNQGMITLDDGTRLPFFYIIPRLERDGSVPSTVIRDGKSLELLLSARFDDDSLIPPLQGAQPSFFACGPFVFSPARQEAVDVYFRVRPALYFIESPLSRRAADRATAETEELVVITAPMVPHPIARHYGEPFGQVVQSVNNTPIRSLRHLVETLRDSEDPFLVFQFVDKAEILVFHRQEFLDSTEEAMLDSGIPRRGSDDMLEVWSNAKKSPDEKAPDEKPRD